MASKHSHTGVIYPSRPLDAPNDGHFACSTPLYTHADFTDPALHNLNNRRKWHFLKHPVRSAVCSDTGLLKSYMRALNDPDFPPEKHNDPAIVVSVHNVIDVARALYKWCYTHPIHETSPSQKQAIIDTRPSLGLKDLMFYDQTGQHERLKLSRTHPRTGPLFNKGPTKGRVLKRPLESNAARTASQKRPRNETAAEQPITPSTQNTITYMEAAVANSVRSAPTDTARAANSAPSVPIATQRAGNSAPSAPTDSAPAGNSEPSSPTDTGNSAPSAPTPAVSAATNCEVTAPMCASASQGAAPEVDPESEEEEGPYFCFAHGPIYLDP
ncbi:hypothetical protein C8F04DRAFT_1269650 [Mycena alexandri]|uniref:Uncharacterized protein n=1 Tax=Mycena alexandri TaxID=1745969 RepID=A0AAD6SC78_9AGAR|nr:hypothetical protein C8F04DRAFT_1269650 [Mycena alexandri]